MLANESLLPSSTQSRLSPENSEKKGQVDSVFRCEHGAIGGSYCCTDFVSETSSENGSDTGSLYAVNSLCNPAAHMLSDKVFGESMDSSDVSIVSRTSSVSCTVSSSDAQLFEIPFEDLPVLTKSFSGAGTQHRPDSHTCTARTDPAVSGIFEIHGVPISTDSESPVASVSGVLEANVYSLPNMKQSDKETQTNIIQHRTTNSRPHHCMNPTAWLTTFTVPSWRLF